MGNELSLAANNGLNIPHFNAVWEPKKWTITYTAGDGLWRGFIRNSALPLNQVTTCQIKQTKTTRNNLMTGIATNAVFGTPEPYLNKECLAYDS